MGDPSLLWFYLLSGFWVLVSVGLSIAFLVLAFKVKSVRPDVFGLFLSSGVLSLFSATVGTLVSWLLPMIVMRMVESKDVMLATFAASAISTGFYMLLGGVSSVLTMTGIWRLANPPSVNDPFAQGRYQ